MKINVIITAGGTSQRYGMENKLFAPCKDSCVVVESIKPFLTFKQVSKVIVAIHPSYSDELLNALEIAKTIALHSRKAERRELKRYNTAFVPSRTIATTS